MLNIEILAKVTQKLFVDFVVLLKCYFLCEIIGIVFVMFAELWVTFFRHVRNYGAKFFNQNGTSPFKIRLS